MITTVSLVGRTNVGKSSIFNKLAKSKSALVSEFEGLTRDIKTATIKKDNKTINLIDTGGFYTSKDDNFEEMILAKAFEAIELSQIILFVVDKKFGISPYDKEIASIIRKSNKKVILVINKIDVKTIEGTSIFDEFGFNDIERDIKLGGEISLVFWLIGGFFTLFFGYFTDIASRKKLLIISLSFLDTSTLSADAIAWGDLEVLVSSLVDFFWSCL